MESHLLLVRDHQQYLHDAAFLWLLITEVHAQKFVNLDLRLLVPEGRHVCRQLLVQLLGPNSLWLPQGTTPKLGHPTYLRFIFSCRIIL